MRQEVSVADLLERYAGIGDNICVDVPLDIACEIEHARAAFHAQDGFATGQESRPAASVKSALLARYDVELEPGPGCAVSELQRDLPFLRPELAKPVRHDAGAVSDIDRPRG